MISITGTIEVNLDEAQQKKVTRATIHQYLGGGYDNFSIIKGDLIGRSRGQEYTIREANSDDKALVKVLELVCE